MYNLIYKVPFTNVDGISYEVRILEDGGSGTPVVLTGGTPPFIVEIKEDDFLYTPTRFSGATLKLVGSDYLQKLFSTQYQKYKVNLMRGNTVVWTGFISPELYSQDFDNSLFELEIECISALATLEYIEYKKTSEIITFEDLLIKCITESNGDFNGVYYPKTYSEGLNSISVSSANFFDEDGKAMTLKECLEEVCKFLNWTCFEYNGNVYFIDVDYIKAGKTAYTNLLTNTAVTLSSVVDISKITSKGTDNNLSILGGYNKAVVIASDYEVESKQLFPEITKDQDLGTSTRTTGKDGKSGSNAKYYYRWWKSDNFKLFQYKYSGGNFVESDAGTAVYNAGAYILENAAADLDDKPNKLD